MLSRTTLLMAIMAVAMPIAAFSAQVGVGELCKYCVDGRLKKSEYDLAAQQAFVDTENARQEAQEWINFALKEVIGPVHEQYESSQAQLSPEEQKTFKAMKRAQANLLQRSVALQKAVDAVGASKQDLVKVQSCAQVVDFLRHLSQKAGLVQSNVGSIERALTAWLLAFVELYDPFTEAKLPLALDNVSAEPNKNLNEEEQMRSLINDFIILAVTEMYESLSQELDEILAGLSEISQGKVITSGNQKRKPSPKAITPAQVEQDFADVEDE